MGKMTKTVKNASKKMNGVNIMKKMSCRRLGVPSEWEINDVFGLDDELLLMLPQVSAFYDPYLKLSSHASTFQHF